jgi:hypothetical protein
MVSFAVLNQQLLPHVTFGDTVTTTPTQKCHVLFEWTLNLPFWYASVLHEQSDQWLVTLFGSWAVLKKIATPRASGLSNLN